jgi:hypothetical protein
MLLTLQDSGLHLTYSNYSTRRFRVLICDSWGWYLERNKAGGVVVCW